MTVTAVIVDVEKIVEDVTGGGSASEGDKSERTMNEAARRQAMREQKRQKQEKILDPLMKAQGGKQRCAKRRAIKQRGLDRDICPGEGAAKSVGGIGQESVACVSEQRKVDARVADVVEGGKEFLKNGELPATSEIAFAIGGDYAIEAAKVAGYALGEASIGAGDEQDGAAQAALVAEQAQNGLVPGQVVDVESSLPGDLLLESRPAARKQAGDGKESGRVSAHEKQKRVLKGVGFDESSVEIDAERNGLRVDERCLRLFDRNCGENRRWHG